MACVLGLAPVYAADEPELYLSLQGVADETVEQGEPLLVSVLIEAPAGTTGSWLLAPVSGTWVDAIAVEVLAESGSETLVRGQAVGTPEQPQATIDKEQVAGGLWRFPAELMQRLTPGAYRLRATLVLADGAGWKGTLAAEELPLSVIPPSAEAGRAGLKTLALARDALLAGEAETAAKYLDTELQRDPINFRVLLLRAAIAEQAGNPLAARLLLNLAHLSSAEMAGGYPNVEFEEMSSRLWQKLLRQDPDTTPAEPPAWSWPPENVLRALADQETAASSAESERTAGAGGDSTPADQGQTVIPAMADTTPASTDAPVSGPGLVAEPAAQATPATTATDSTAADGDAPRYWLGDQAVPASSNGQWASSARAGSQYGDLERSAARATGAPDVPGTDDHPNAWCPATRDSGGDWLELTFANAAPATEIRVRQNYGPGAIVKVEAIEPGGQAHTWWEGIDPYGQEGFANDAVWFSVSVPPTAYDVQKIRLTLDLGAHGRWKQIDAVQLLGVTAD